MVMRALLAVVCAGVLMSALVWVLVARTGPALPAETNLAAPFSPLPGDSPWTRLLGDDPVSLKAPAPAAESAGPALTLVGLMASGNEGLALISRADGSPRVFRVGAVVHGDTVLKSVSAREVRLGPRDGPASMVLALPTSASAGVQPIGSAPYKPAPATEDPNDTSPIVPPHTDMSAPRASESGTAGSQWNELRTKAVTR
jgi:hypothetical protein